MLVIHLVVVNRLYLGSPYLYQLIPISYLYGRSVDNKDEIRAYIKARSKLSCSLKKLMTEISTAFGPSCVSYDTVRRWKKKFESGVESIKNAPKWGRPKSASRKEIVSKIKEIIEGDARFTVRDIARKVGISLSTVHLILKKHLKVRKISARWVPHLLTDEQKRVRVAKKLLQMFPKYDKKQFANVVTGDETWVHYFEPVRKVSNKIWATKHSKRSIIAKRSLSTKKVLYAIFFSGEGVTIKVPVKKIKSITGKYYKDVVLKKLKKYYQKRRPATGLTCPSSTWQCPSSYLRNSYGVFEERKSNCFASPPPPPHPVFPRPCPMWFQLLPKLKAFLAGRKYQSRQALGSAIHQYLITVPKSAYRDAFKKWIHRLKLCISSHGEYFKGMKWVLLG